MQRNMYRTMRIQSQKQRRGERALYRMLHLADPAIPSCSPFPICATKPSDIDLHLYLRIAAPFAGGSTPRWLFGAGDCAYNLRVALFEVGGAVCGGLSADLSVKVAELVPAAAV